MKKFLALTAISAAMFLAVSCGGSGSSDNGGESGYQQCSYGDYECEDGNSYWCGYSGNDLLWQFFEECPNGCDYATGRCAADNGNNSGNNAGNNNGGNNGGNNNGDNNGGNNNGDGNNQKPACNNGDYRCSGSARLQCQNDNWEFAENCENGCDASTGNCNAKSEGNEENVNSGENTDTVICSENEYECSGDQKMQCKNNDWTVVETCENGCESGECQEAQPDNSCTDGTLKCSDDGANVMICEDNEWTEHEVCSISCNTSKNKCLECSNGDKCNGDMLMTCSDGEWTFKETCSLGCANDKCNVCTPNCGGKQCGLDGCGGICGNCDAGYDCTAAAQCVKNNSCSKHDDCSGDDVCYKNFCQSPWNKKWKITFKDAKVSEKDKNNESWDALGGLPDLFSIVFVNDSQVYRTSTIQDSTTAVWNKSTTLDFAASTDNIKICLYDEDWTSGITGGAIDDSNDMVGCLYFGSDLFRKFDETDKFFTFKSNNGVPLQYWRIAFEPAW